MGRSVSLCHDCDPCRPKTDEAIEISFGLVGRVVPRNRVLDGGSISHTGSPGRVDFSFLCMHSHSRNAFVKRDNVRFRSDNRLYQ